MTEKKETVLVIGASTKPARYSYKAAVALCDKGHSVILLGMTKGEVCGTQIQNEFPSPDVAIDSITLYLNPTKQKAYYDLILNAGARRIIMNPGAENEELAEKAEAKGIKVEMACTLVMLSVGTF